MSYPDFIVSVIFVEESVVSLSKPPRGFLSLTGSNSYPSLGVSLSIGSEAGR